MKTTSFIERLRNGLTKSFGLGLAVLVFGAARAADAPLAPELLEKGIYTEETKGDIKGATEIYQQIVDDPRAEALKAAHEIAAKNPDAIRAAKRMIDDLSIDPGPALLAESVEQKKLIGTANQREAVRANLEKRAPRFADAS